MSDAEMFLIILFGKGVATKVTHVIRNWAIRLQINAALSDVYVGKQSEFH